MAKRILRAWAENGDRSPVPDDTQSGGSVSYQQGFGAQYELNPASDPSARRINRGRFNQVRHDITDNIKEWQERLAPNFITSAANGGTAFSYALGMVVYDPDNSKYRRSTSANNTANVTDDDNWEDYDFSAGGFGLPIGVPYPWPLAAAPDGHLLVMGQSFDTTANPKLALAYPSGVLPDMRGYSIRGWDNGRGIDTGRTLLSEQQDQIANHEHVAGNVSAYLATVSGQNDLQVGTSGTSFGLRPSVDVGGTETRVKNIAFNWIVRAG